ncbi:MULTISPECIES: DUF3253 domain-containing protein [Methylobacterium]|uniref:DUF3253 domain-containing protein n=1 Tax=Methylobacterium TaxID=407 RepID=UPI0013ED0CFF|nr:DUF3253 domain-containing protein [Methylobacterium sp. DB0501]NGM36822.1 DUF3253 domain-containing protein [Methylobacterium sp. DB0501]
MIPDDFELELTLMRLVTERGADKTVCPSEVARALGGPHPDGWGPLMQPVRRQAVRLMKQGRIAILRKGKVVDDPDDFRGVYRLSLPRSADQGAGNTDSV